MASESLDLSPASTAMTNAANIARPESDNRAHELGQSASDEYAARLVELAQQGDRNAFGALYELHHGAISRYARLKLGESFEDAVSETFLRAWKALPRYKKEKVPFVAWLYGIARHVVVDELRARGRVSPTDKLPEHSVDPDHDERLALRAALARLPRRQRQVLEMKFLMGVTNPELAAALDKTPGAINAQQWRALRALKEILERQ